MAHFPLPINSSAAQTAQSPSAYPVAAGRLPPQRPRRARTQSPISWKCPPYSTRPPQRREDAAYVYRIPRLVVDRPNWEIEAKDGLPSADRNNKATLLLTGPFRTAKSSAKDLTPLVLKLQYAKYRDALRAPRRNRLLRR